MRRWIPALALLLTGLAVAGGTIPEIGGHSHGEPSTRPSEATDGGPLADPDTADAVARQWLAEGEAGTAKLLEVALHGSDLAARGRAIVALVEAEGKEVEPALEKLRNDAEAPLLVRVWAYAALLRRAPDLDTLLALAPDLHRYPGAQRPFELAAAPLLKSANTIRLLELAHQVPALNGTLAPLLLKRPVVELAELMLVNPLDAVRRQAAAWLAVQGREGKAAEVAERVIAQLRYRPGTKRVPWEGGALYVPAIPWEQAQARALVRTLIQWKLHCERTGMSDARQQVWNNLRSVALLEAAGFSNLWPSEDELLEEWAKIAGRDDVAKLRAEQGWR